MEEEVEEKKPGSWLDGGVGVGWCLLTK